MVDVGDGSTDRRVQELFKIALVVFASSVEAGALLHDARAGQ